MEDPEEDKPSDKENILYNIANADLLENLETSIRQKKVRKRSSSDRGENRRSLKRKVSFATTFQVLEFQTETKIVEPDNDPEAENFSKQLPTPEELLEPPPIPEKVATSEGKSANSYCGNSSVSGVTYSSILKESIENTDTSLFLRDILNTEKRSTVDKDQHESSAKKAKKEVSNGSKNTALDRFSSDQSLKETTLENTLHNQFGLHVSEQHINVPDEFLERTNDEELSICYLETSDVVAKVADPNGLIVEEDIGDDIFNPSFLKSDDENDSGLADGDNILCEKMFSSSKTSAAISDEIKYKGKQANITTRDIANMSITMFDAKDISIRALPNESDSFLMLKKCGNLTQSNKTAILDESMDITCKLFSNRNSKISSRNHGSVHNSSFVGDRDSFSMEKKDVTVGHPNKTALFDDSMNITCKLTSNSNQKSKTSSHPLASDLSLLIGSDSPLMPQKNIILAQSNKTALLDDSVDFTCKSTSIQCSKVSASGCNLSPDSSFEEERDSSLIQKKSGNLGQLNKSVLFDDSMDFTCKLTSSRSSKLSSSRSSKLSSSSHNLNPNAMAKKSINLTQSNKTALLDDSMDFTCKLASNRSSRGFPKGRHSVLDSSRPNDIHQARSNKTLLCNDSMDLTYKLASTTNNTTAPSGSNYSLNDAEGKSSVNNFSYSSDIHPISEKCAEEQKSANTSRCLHDGVMALDNLHFGVVGHVNEVEKVYPNTDTSMPKSYHQSLNSSETLGENFSLQASEFLIPNKTMLFEKSVEETKAVPAHVLHGEKDNRESSSTTGNTTLFTSEKIDLASSNLSSLQEDENHGIWANVLPAVIAVDEKGIQTKTEEEFSKAAFKLLPSEAVEYTEESPVAKIGKIPMSNKTILGEKSLEETKIATYPIVPKHSGNCSITSSSKFSDATTFNIKNMDLTVPNTSGWREDKELFSESISKYNFNDSLNVPIKISLSQILNETDSDIRSMLDDSIDSLKLPYEIEQLTCEPLKYIEKDSALGCDDENFEEKPDEANLTALLLDASLPCNDTFEEKMDEANLTALLPDSSPINASLLETSPINASLLETSPINASLLETSPINASLQKTASNSASLLKTSMDNSSLTKSSKRKALDESECCSPPKMMHVFSPESPAEQMDASIEKSRNCPSVELDFDFPEAGTVTSNKTSLLMRDMDITCSNPKQCILESSRSSTSPKNDLNSSWIHKPNSFKSPDCSTDDIFSSNSRVSLYSVSGSPLCSKVSLLNEAQTGHGVELKAKPPLYCNNRTQRFSSQGMDLTCLESEHTLKLHERNTIERPFGDTTSQHDLLLNNCTIGEKSIREIDNTFKFNVVGMDFTCNVSTRFEVEANRSVAKLNIGDSNIHFSNLQLDANAIQQIPDSNPQQLLETVAISKDGSYESNEKNVSAIESVSPALSDIPDPKNDVLEASSNLPSPIIEGYLRHLSFVEKDQDKSHLGISQSNQIEKDIASSPDILPSSDKEDSSMRENSMPLFDVKALNNLEEVSDPHPNLSHFSANNSRKYSFNESRVSIPYIDETRLPNVDSETLENDTEKNLDVKKSEDNPCYDKREEPSSERRMGVTVQASSNEVPAALLNINIHDAHQKAVSGHADTCFAETNPSPIGIKYIKNSIPDAKFVKSSEFDFKIPNSLKDSSDQPTTLIPKTTFPELNSAVKHTKMVNLKQMLSSKRKMYQLPDENLASAFDQQVREDITESTLKSLGVTVQSAKTKPLAKLNQIASTDKVASHVEKPANKKPRTVSQFDVLFKIRNLKKVALQTQRTCSDSNSLASAFDGDKVTSVQSAVKEKTRPASPVTEKKVACKVDQTDLQSDNSCKAEIKSLSERKSVYEHTITSAERPCDDAMSASGTTKFTKSTHAGFNIPNKNTCTDYFKSPFIKSFKADTIGDSFQLLSDSCLKDATFELDSFCLEKLTKQGQMLEETKVVGNLSCVVPIAHSTVCEGHDVFDSTANDHNNILSNKTLCSENTLPKETRKTYVIQNNKSHLEDKHLDETLTADDLNEFGNKESEYESVFLESINKVESKPNAETFLTKDERHVDVFAKSHESQLTEEENLREKRMIAIKDVFEKDDMEGVQVNDAESDTLVINDHKKTQEKSIGKSFSNKYIHEVRESPTLEVFKDSTNTELEVNDVCKTPTISDVDSSEHNTVTMNNTSIPKSEANVLMSNNADSEMSTRDHFRHGNHIFKQPSSQTKCVEIFHKESQIDKYIPLSPVTQKDNESSYIILLSQENTKKAALGTPQNDHGREKISSDKSLEICPKEPSDDKAVPLSPVARNDNDSSYIIMLSQEDTKTAACDIVQNDDSREKFLPHESVEIFHKESSVNKDVSLLPIAQNNESSYVIMLSQGDTTKANDTIQNDDGQEKVAPGNDAYQNCHMEELSISVLNISRNNLNEEPSVVGNEMAKEDTVAKVSEERVQPSHEIIQCQENYASDTKPTEIELAEKSIDNDITNEKEILKLPDNSPKHNCFSGEHETQSLDSETQITPVFQDNHCAKKVTGYHDGILKNCPNDNPCQESTVVNSMHQNTLAEKNIENDLFEAKQNDIENDLIEAERKDDENLIKENSVFSLCEVKKAHVDEVEIPMEHADIGVEELENNCTSKKESSVQNMCQDKWERSGFSRTCLVEYSYSSIESLNESNLTIPVHEDDRHKGDVELSVEYTKGKQKIDHSEEFVESHKEHLAEIYPENVDQGNFSVEASKDDTGIGKNNVEKSPEYIDNKGSFSVEVSKEKVKDGMSSKYVDKDRLPVESDIFREKAKAGMVTDCDVKESSSVEMDKENTDKMLPDCVVSENGNSSCRLIENKVVYLALEHREEMPLSKKSDKNELEQEQSISKCMSQELNLDKSNADHISQEKTLIRQSKDEEHINNEVDDVEQEIMECDVISSKELLIQDIECHDTKINGTGGLCQKIVVNVTETENDKLSGKNPDEVHMDCDDSEAIQPITEKCSKEFNVEMAISETPCSGHKLPKRTLLEMLNNESVAADIELQSSSETLNEMLEEHCGIETESTLKETQSSCEMLHFSPKFLPKTPDQSVIVSQENKISHMKKDAIITEKTADCIVETELSIEEPMMDIEDTPLCSASMKSFERLVTVNDVLVDVYNIEKRQNMPWIITEVDESKIIFSFVWDSVITQIDTFWDLRMTVQFGDDVNLETEDSTNIVRKLYSVSFESVFHENVHDVVKLAPKIFHQALGRESLTEQYPDTTFLLKLLCHCSKAVRRTRGFIRDAEVTLKRHSISIQEDLLIVQITSITLMSKFQLKLPISDIGFYPHVKFVPVGVAYMYGQPISEQTIQDKVQEIVPGKHYLYNVVIAIERMKP